MILMSVFVSLWVPAFAGTTDYLHNLRFPIYSVIPAKAGIHN